MLLIIIILLMFPVSSEIGLLAALAYFAFTLSTELMGMAGARRI